MLPSIAVEPVAEDALPSEAPVEAAAVAAEPFEGQAEPLPPELPDAELEPLPEAEPVFHLPAGLPPRTGASPRARRAARQAEVDISRVQGTGPFGRVEQRDVDAYLEARSAVQPQPGAAATAIRRVIAQRMIRSAQSTAPVTLVTEVDATELVLLRQRLEPMIAGRTGYPLSYDLLLARIVGLALGEFPALNAHITDQGAELVESVNLGIAVDTPRGLLVPVLHDVSEKDLEALARELGGLMDRARRGSILPSEMEGGTFTITNLGGYGVDAFTPLINLPECAILGVGRIAAKPVVQQGQIAIRQMMTLSLTFDHRVVDGGPAARFLQRVSHLIQTAGSLTQLVDSPLRSGHAPQRPVVLVTPSPSPAAARLPLSLSQAATGAPGGPGSLPCKPGTSGARASRPASSRSPFGHASQPCMPGTRDAQRAGCPLSGGRAGMGRGGPCLPISPLARAIVDSLSL